MILITGATGAIGPFVVKAFHDAGYAVRTLSLDHPPVGIWPDNVETRIGDITDSIAVQEAMKGIESVIHMAALLHIVNPSSEMLEKYQRVNIGGTKNVVDTATAMGVTRLVMFSTIAVYGHSNGAILSEMSPTCPDTFYAQTKLAAEQVVLNAKNFKGEPLGTVLRFGAIYGSRIKGNYEKLIHTLAKHRFIPIGKGLNRRTLVYVKDVGRAAVLSVSNPDVAGMLLNVTDGRFHTLNEIIESICYALGRKPPHFSLPLPVTSTLINLIETGCHSIGLRPLVTREMIDKYTEDIAVDGSLFEKTVGFMPHYDLKKGWEETIRERNSFK